MGTVIQANYRISASCGGLVFMSRAPLQTAERPNFWEDNLEGQGVARVHLPTQALPWQNNHKFLSWIHRWCPIWGSYLEGQLLLASENTHVRVSCNLFSNACLVAGSAIKSVCNPEEAALRHLKCGAAQLRAQSSRGKSKLQRAAGLA